MQCTKGFFILQTMKKLCIIFYVFWLISFTQAQNLVPNYSFEYDTIGPGYTYIYYALPWFQPSTYAGNTTNSSSSDTFGPSSIDAGVPSNTNGFQYARTGSQYAGIFTYVDTSNVREYIEVSLTSSLIANRTYCVKYYVSLANTVGTAISNMGAYFSVDSLLIPTYYAIDYVTPQIENPIGNMLSDTLNWMLVSGSFIAIGGEKFMTIGNFHNAANTNSQVVNSAAIGSSLYRAYYYIDDVSVVDCTSGAGVQEVTKLSDDFKLYPNPNNGSMTLEYKLTSTETATFIIYDVSGRLVKQQTLSSENKTAIINAFELDAGAYYYDIKVGESKVKSDKLIIIK